jgi:hypothetical protein
MRGPEVGSGAVSFLEAGMVKQLSASLLAHDGASHAGDGSMRMLISMVALSVFLLAFAWALVRPSKPSVSTPADIAAERFAHGEIDADDFERAVRDLKSRRP